MLCQFFQAVNKQHGDNPPRVELQTLPYSYLSTNHSNAIFVIFWAYYCCLLLFLEYGVARYMPKRK